MARYFVISRFYFGELDSAKYANCRLLSVVQRQRLLSLISNRCKKKKTSTTTIESFSQKLCLLCLILCVPKLLIRLFRYGFATDFPNQAWGTLFYVDIITETLYRFSCPNEIVYLLPKGFKSWPVIMRRLTFASLPVQLIPGDDALFIISPLTQGWGLCLSLTDL